MRRLVLLLLLLAAGALLAGGATTSGGERTAVVTMYRVARPQGLIVTSGGWAYCEQVRKLARRTRYALLCARFVKDGYTGLGLRARRHLDWGNARYLAELAAAVRTTQRSVGGRLVFLGVSYSGFGVATLAAHHPDLRPDRLIVIDAYFDLVARRRLLPSRHLTAREIDAETGGSLAELRRRSATAGGLAAALRRGTRLTALWTVSEQERRFFNGATCGRDAMAATLLRLAGVLRRPIAAWITTNRHGVNLWRHGRGILAGRNPGRRVVFRPGGRIPESAVCGAPDARG